MLEKIKVSVIIPTYNQKEEYLTCAIQSVQNQIYSAHEIIVVNDGGNNVPGLMFYDNDAIYIEKEKNEGTASALNEGIKNATGTHIAWLSSDDFFYPEFLAYHASILSNEQCTSKLSYCGFSSVVVNDQDEILHLTQHNPPIENKQRCPYILSQQEFHDSLIRNLHAGSCQWNGCGFVLEKSVIDDIGEFDVDNKFTQDFQYWLRVSKKYNVAIIPNILMGRREHSGRTQFMWSQEEFIQQREKEFKAMKKQFLNW